MHVNGYEKAVSEMELLFLTLNRLKAENNNGKGLAPDEEADIKSLNALLYISLVFQNVTRLTI